MLNIKKRMILSFVINILMVLIFISAIANEIVDIYNNPNSVYQNVWGLFRYFTIDGNFLSFIFNIIIGFKQYQSLRLYNPRYIEEKIVTHFLYMISLISSCNEIVIFTAALQKYADLVINSIDPNRVISYRLYRQHTISIGNSNVKDLAKLGRDLRRVIIVDNCLICCFLKY